MPTKKDKFLGKIIEFGILALLVFSPLPAASVNEWSILIIQLSVLIMMAAYILMKEKPNNNIFLSHSLKWSRYLFIGLFIFIFIQVIPLPKFIVQIFSPGTLSYNNAFSVNLQTLKFMSISVILGQTLRASLELLSYFLLGFLIIKTVTTRKQIMRIFSVLVAIGAFEAFYGLFELSNKHPRILFYRKIHMLDAVTGTFVNRNHFSGYLEMIIPLAIGLVIARIDLFSLSGLKWKEKLLRLSEKGLATNILISLSVVLMSLGIIFSKSRSGVAILIITFLLFFELTILYFKTTKERKKWVRMFLGSAFLIITIISLYLGIGATIERFSLDHLLSEQRPTFWANALQIFSRFPLFGSGLGTFTGLYPDIEQDGVLVRAFHAHNDYLEYLAELGILGMGLLLGGILFLVLKSFFVWRGRKHPEVKGLALGGLVSLVAILIHSLTDFNLHIPANMLLFSVLISVTMVVSFYKRGEHKIREK
jgi:O-antigen ligase